MSLHAKWPASCTKALHLSDQNQETPEDCQSEREKLSHNFRNIPGLSPPHSRGPASMSSGSASGAFASDAAMVSALSWGGGGLPGLAVCSGRQLLRRALGLWEGFVHLGRNAPRVT